MAVPEVRRELVRIALPVIGLNLLGVLSLGIDTAICGHLPAGETALAAMGFATQLVLATNVAVLGLTVGAVAMISRAHGAKDAARVTHVLGQSMLICALAALALGGVANVVASPVLTLLGARGDAHAYALDYVRPMLGLSLFHFLTTLLAGAMRAVGRTFLPFTVALVSTLVHVLLAVLFIHGGLGLPSYGVHGAAMSAVASQALSLVLMLAVLRSGRVPGLALAWGLPRIDGVLVRRLAALGLPAALDMLVIHGSFLVIVAMLASFGDASVAANSVGLRVQSFAFVPGLAISQATAAMVGAALGAADVTRARHVAHASVAFTVALMIVLGLALYAASPVILALFAVRDGTAVYALATTWMRVLGLSLPVAGANIALVGVLRGAGATTQSLAVNLVGTLAVQVPASYVLAYALGLGTFGIWLAVPVAFAARLAASLAFYRRGAWARTGAH